MSYEKIKSMTIKEDKEGNVHFKMLVASNNVTPIDYENWSGVRTWEEFFYNLLGECWQPNDSANNYFWKALMIIFFETVKKNGDDSYEVWLGHHLGNEATKEQKVLFVKYLKVFKELYCRLKSLSSLSYKFVVKDNDYGYITKMTKNYVWRSHYDYKLCTLCKAIVLYHRLKNNYSPNSPIILYIGIEENSIIKDFLTQNLF